MNQSGVTPNRPRNSRVFRDDGIEYVLPVPDEVHLVDEDRNLTDAEHRQHEAVPARVLLDAFLRVDDEQRGFGPRGASDHVLQELDVSGSVDDDVVAAAPS